MKYLVTRLAPFMVALGPFTGCGAADAGRDSSGSEHWATPAGEPETRRLVEDPLICRDCIRAELDLVLGDSSGPGYVVHTEYAVRDSLGRYWLGQYADMIKVFASGGKYLRTVGRRGEGPEEFQIPLPLFTDAEGLVHIVDPGNLRTTIVRPDFALHATCRLPMNPWGIAPLGEKCEYVVNGPVRSVEALGHPLHLVNASEITRSFGAPEAGIMDPDDVRRVVAVDDSRRIYSAQTDDFVVEVWTASGQKITEFVGPPLRENDPQPEPKTRYTPHSTITGLSIDRAGRLWILIAKPGDNWREHMEEVPLPNGWVRLQPRNDELGKIYDTQLLIVDPAANSIIARSEWSNYFVDFLGDDSLLEIRQLEDGTPQMGVWTVEFSQQRTAGRENHAQEIARSHDRLDAARPLSRR